MDFGSGRGLWHLPICVVHAMAEYKEGCGRESKKGDHAEKDNAEPAVSGDQRKLRVEYVELKVR